jgi:hypothetical protein
MSGALDLFYKDSKWPNWKNDVKKLTGSQGFSFFPPLFSKGPYPLDKRTMAPVPIDELWKFGMDAKEQMELNDIPENGKFNFDFI